MLFVIGIEPIKITTQLIAIKSKRLCFLKREENNISDTKMITAILSAAQRSHMHVIIASSLSINPNTIQKAYRELEQEGYIYSVAAKGNYVSPRENTYAVNSARTEELRENFKAILSEMKFLGMSMEDALRLAEEVFGENKQ